MGLWQSRIAGPGAVQLVDVAYTPGGAAGLAEVVRAHLEDRGLLGVGQEPQAAERNLLVVGGGATGLAAADEAARRGVSVTLVEEDESLGGSPRSRLFLSEAQTEALDGLIERATSSDLIDVHLGSNVASVDRSNGAFAAVVKGPDEEQSLPFGAVIFATENEDYDPADFGSRDGASVLTQAGFAEQLRDGPPSAEKIVMIQCVGSRTAEWPICSRRCCAEAMANVLRLKAQKPDADVTVLHKGIRVWGLDEEMFSDAIDAGIRFVRVEDEPAVSADGGLAVAAVDADTGDKLSLSPDLVVLSNGVRPPESNARIADALGLGADPYGFLVPRDEALAPLDSAIAGVYVCGPTVGPTVAAEGAVQGRAAAGRACLFMKGNVR
jgi:heterodisulfide reductase subunit A